MHTQILKKVKNFLNESGKGDKRAVHRKNNIQNVAI